MSKRKYAHIKEIEPELLAMRTLAALGRKLRITLVWRKIRLKIGSVIITVHKIGFQLACRPSTVVAPGRMPLLPALRSTNMKSND